MTSTLSQQQVQQFVEDGFVRIEAAFPRSLADQGRALIWNDMKINPLDKSTWVKPVVRLVPSSDHLFGKAVNSERLKSAYDQLAGKAQWIERPNVGLFVVRFPHSSEPDDTGWHVDGSYALNDTYYLNVHSQDRALLMLFLFSDVSEIDAPTRIRVGSHKDVPKILHSAGQTGMSFSDCSALCEPASAHRPEVVAIGRAGDVYLCHPFLVHSAQKNNGSEPRFMAQPGLMNRTPMDLDSAKADQQCSPVELSVRLALRASGKPLVKAKSD